MSERELQNRIRGWRFKAHRLIVPNAHYWSGESDIISITRSGYVHEYEIKCSRQDFQADFKSKAAKHMALDSVFLHGDVNKLHRRFRRIPNYSSFVVPQGLVESWEVPVYAGLYEFGKLYFPSELQKPPLLHSNKISASNHIMLAEKMQHRYWNMRK